MHIRQLVDALNSYFQLENFSKEWGYNGLQVGGDWEVSCVVLAVNCCRSAIDFALANGAQMLVTHHGLLWGKDLPITDGVYKLIETCINGRLAIYAVHLPLDAHSQVGTSICLANYFGVKSGRPFVQYHGVELGLVGQLEQPTPIVHLQQRAMSLPKSSVRFYGNDSTIVKSVAFLPGSASPSDAVLAKQAGAELLITGEHSLALALQAELIELPVLFVGHSASEFLAIEALGKIFEQTFGVKAIVHRDFPQI